MNQDNRRQLLLALGAGSLLVSLPILAQQGKRVRRIGFLSLGDVQATAKYHAAFREGMSELHWVEGRDYVIDVRYTNGVVQAGPSLAAELVASQPDLLLSVADEGVRQLALETKTIPIVFAMARDPIGNGIAESLRRPGGNATGLTSLASEIGAKRLQLLKEAFPRVAHVALLFEPDNLGSVSEAKQIKDAGPRLGMSVTGIELRQVEDIESAFRRGTAVGVQAYVMTQGGVISSQLRAIIDRIIRLKVPASFPGDQYVEAGGLMSYSPSFRDSFRRAAAYVDKIMKGAKPGDLPIEQPTKFELVINMKTAKAMGFKIPQSILLQATRLIE